MLFLFLLDLYRRALGTKSEAESGVGPGALWSPKGGATTAVDSAVVSVAPGDATLWLPATVLAEVVCSAQAGIFCQVAVLASMTAYTAHAASVCLGDGRLCQYRSESDDNSVIFHIDKALACLEESLYRLQLTQVMAFLCLK